MGFGLRWFQIFYLILSTYFVGNALGGLASLRADIQAIRRTTAWQRREVTKGMMDEMQGYDHDDKIDQYEFAVASLLTLGKVTSDDLLPIMDKFRELCDDSGFICISGAREEEAAELHHPESNENIAAAASGSADEGGTRRNRYSRKLSALSRRDILELREQSQLM